MTKNPGLFQELSLPSKLPRYLSPFWQFIMMATMIFIAEMIAMLVIYYVRLSNYVVEALLDGTIMILLIAPVLFFFQMRPILRHMKERDAATKALRESEKLLRTVLRLLPVGVWIIDEKGEIQHGNPASHEIWRGAKYVGIDQYSDYKGWWLDTGKRIKPEEWAATRAIRNGETSLNEEIEIEAFDGTHKIILNSGTPIIDDNSAIAGAIIVNQDITERKHREQELIHTNELLERFFSSIDTLIAYMDRDFNFIRVNDSYAISGGHPPEFFTGKNHFDLYPHPENEAIFRQVVETGEPFTVLEKPFEYPEFPERGVTYWDWSLQPVKGVDRSVEGVVLSLVDVTERKRAEIQLERQNQELRELSATEHQQRVLAESLVQSAIALTSSLEFEEVLASILDQIRRAIPFRGADIVLVEGNTIRMAAFSGFEGYPSSQKTMEKTFLIEDFPLFSKICSSLEPVIINSTETHAEWRVAPGMEWVRSYLAAPLISAGKVIGIINLTSEMPEFFDQQSLEKLLVLASPASAALRNAQLYNAEQTAHHAAETLRSAAIALSRSLDLDQVINTLLDHLGAIIPSDTSIVSLLSGTDHLSVRAARGFIHQPAFDPILSHGRDIETNSLLYRLITSRESILIPDTSTFPNWQATPDDSPVGAWIGVPVLVGDQTIGVLSLGKREKHSFTSEHRTWAEALIRQAAIAIQNAWLFEQVRASSERLQSLAQKLVDVQEKERIFIAQELHDEAGQSLSILKIGIGRLEQSPDCPESMRLRLQELKSMADSVLENLHRLAMDLRPASLDHLGLIAALEQHANTINNDMLTVEFKALGFEEERLPSNLETALYRIVQEALTNVVRHARASTVGILLERLEGRVILFVEDDGVGFDPALIDGSSMGLVGIRERAELLGGILTVESTPGKGTSIRVEVPDAVADLNR